MKLKEEEMLFKEEKIMEEDSRLRLEDEAKLMREEEKLLEDEQCSKIDYKKDEYALMNSESMKQVMARVVPKKRSHCTGVTSSTWLKRIQTCILDKLACFVIDFYGVMIERLIKSSGSL
nr:hypothetical protein [Tanacetum cinerariifolium]